MKLKEKVLNGIENRNELIFAKIEKVKELASNDKKFDLKGIRKLCVEIETLAGEIELLQDLNSPF